MAEPVRLSGRQSQAARNDAIILAAAREVFVADPTAPIAAVADRAGVGISALYRRYASKEELLRTLCRDGQLVFLAVVDEALADDEPADVVFRRFVERAVDADTHSLTSRLAGTFTPTDEHLRLAAETGPKLAAVLDRAKSAGVVRPDLDIRDLTHLFELLSSVRLGTAERSAELRRRYLVYLLDGLTTVPGSPLPGVPPVSPQEAAARWQPRR